MNRDMQIAEAVRDACAAEAFLADDAAYTAVKLIDLAALIASVPAPEPVAWMRSSQSYESHFGFYSPKQVYPDDKPLYAAPPAAEINQQLLYASKGVVRLLKVAGFLIEGTASTPFMEAIAAAERSDKMIDTTKLRELTQQATKGEWELRPAGIDDSGYMQQFNYVQVAKQRVITAEGNSQDEANANAAFIAAANPAATLELLDRLEATERDAKRYRHLRDDEDGFDVAVRNDGDEGEYWVHGYPPEELDAAIDSAMQQEQNQ